MGIAAVRALGKPASVGTKLHSRALGVLFAVTVIAALGLLGWAQLAAFRDPFAPWTEDAAILLRSAWGTRWIAALSISVLVLGTFSVRRLLPVSRVLPFALAAYPALTGHAAGAEPWTLAAILADWLHVIAAGLWIGALWVLLLGGRGVEAPSAPLVRHLHRFSALARAGVLVLVVTGAGASWLHLSDVSALWTHPYGRILSLKLVLVGGLMALGAWNWRVLSPKAHTAQGASRLLATARLEGILGVVVVVVTGWLTGTAPPP